MSSEDKKTLTQAVVASDPTPAKDLKRKRSASPGDKPEPSVSEDELERPNKRSKTKEAGAELVKSDADLAFMIEKNALKAKAAAKACEEIIGGGHALRLGELLDPYTDYYYYTWALKAGYERSIPEKTQEAIEKAMAVLRPSPDNEDEE